MAKSAEIYEKDYSALTTSLFITGVVVLIFAMGVLFGDATTMPVSAYLGATPEEITASSNVTFVKNNWLGICVAIIIMYFVVFAMWRYLQYPENDPSFIPYKRDHNNKKIYLKSINEYL